MDPKIHSLPWETPSCRDEGTHVVAFLSRLANRANVTASTEPGQPALGTRVATPATVLEPFRLLLAPAPRRLTLRYYDLGALLLFTAKRCLLARAVLSSFCLENRLLITYPVARQRPDGWAPGSNLILAGVPHSSSISINREFVVSISSSPILEENHLILGVPLEYER
jgi:hypothetical protein